MTPSTISRRRLFGLGASALAASALLTVERSFPAPAFSTRRAPDRDATAWLQGLLDRGGTVFLPAGTHRVSAPLIPPAYTTVYGDGATIVGADDQPVVALHGHVTWHGGTLLYGNRGTGMAASGEGSTIRSLWVRARPLSWWERSVARLPWHRDGMGIRLGLAA